MSFSLNFQDINLLLAITAIILLITSEILSPQYGNVNIKINRKRLRNVALLISILFLGTLVIIIANMVLAT